jgi:outer membrane protein assembly factor BamB
MYRQVVLAALCTVLFAGADWTRFRGPEGSGVAVDTGLPTTWSAGENVVWKTALPGFGSSSPITLGDKIFLTCYTGYGLDQEQPGQQQQLMLHVLCLDRGTGKIVWQKSHEPKLPETEYAGTRTSLHGYASATAVTDGEAVYFFFGKTGVFKYSLDGELVWKASVGTELDSHRWGSGASLMLHGDLVIVNASCESKSIRALKKEDGSEQWCVDGIVDSWSTPLVVQTPEGGEELVVVERFKVLGLNPTTGEQLWLCNKDSDYVCPSVIAHKGIVYIINSRFKAALLAIRTGGRGDVTDSHVLWTKKRWTTRVCTPVYHEGHLYAIDQAGYASCVNTNSGEEVYRERLDISGDGDKIYASIVAADGKFYGVTRLDGTVVLALKPEFKLLAQNRLGDETVFNATPAISNGQLLLRSDKALYCIGK